MPLGRVLRWGAIVVVASSTSLGCGRDDPKDAVPNVRLGMAPRDVRDRFQPGGEGSWQTALGVGDDTVLEWSSRSPASKVEHARFEFHLGMLVAIRATSKEPSPGGEKISLTSKTVTVRAPQNGTTVFTVLSRDCPTHKEEAEGLAARAK